MVKTHDLGLDPDRRVYLVMEPLRGCSIAALLQWGRPFIVFSLSVAIEAARGVAAAHGANVIHRDVKPSNLFLVNVDGRRTAVKVLDFSLAKVFPEGFETTAARRAALGTPAYMAPEHFACTTPHVGLDVYGLGDHAVGGARGPAPVERSAADLEALIAKQRGEMPPLLSEVAGVPPRVDDVVRCAIAKRREARFQTMTEMADALVALRAWLVQEELAGRLVLPVPMGQPPIPGDVDPCPRRRRSADDHRRHRRTPLSPEEEAVLQTRARAGARQIQGRRDAGDAPHHARGGRRRPAHAPADAPPRPPRRGRQPAPDVSGDPAEQREPGEVEKGDA